jgi:DNA-binding FrmR family transcriptional regulator
MEKAAVEQAENPELELLLSGCTNRQQREAVLDAFHAFADGDHKGFAVKFAILLQAHAAALHATPERILGAVQPVLSEHGRNVTDAAACATRACGEVKDQMTAVLEASARLSELVAQRHAAELTARDQFLHSVQTETKKVTDAAAEILSISEKRIAIGLLTSYLVGVLTWPALDGFVRFVSRLF